MPVLGIDVSHHNGDVDWHAVAGSPLRFAFVKATEGSTFVDPRFRRHWDGLGETGLLRGAYHFARPGGDPEAQAAHFAAVVGPPAWGELPPALDLEADGGLPAAAVVEWTLAFVRKAEALFGRALIVYTGGLWRRTLGDPLVPALSSRLLWTARYGAHEPVVPRTWQRWDFWQFTDGENGQVVAVPGVRGPCDVNRFRGEPAELASLASDGAAPPPPPPPPAPPAPPEPPPWPGRLLVWPHQPPLRGPDVRAWQTRMGALGFALAADGVYGPQSKRACAALQKEVGLDPDGIVGRLTWEASFREPVPA
jgi:lysozyme